MPLFYALTRLFLDTTRVRQTGIEVSVIRFRLVGWLFEENGKSVRCLSIGRFMTKETGLRVYNAIKETEGKSPWVNSD